MIIYFDTSASYGNDTEYKKLIHNIDGITYYEDAKFKRGDITKPFYYIRHGQTDINKYGIAPENRDVSLNEKGILQAKVVDTKKQSTFASVRARNEALNKLWYLIKTIEK